jgi:ADP-heptose:LPS heptosyltransferase
VEVKNQFKRIIISRTDAIGDVMLTLPLCGILKKEFPDVEIIFLGRSYTQSVINCCKHVDGFLNADELLANKKEAVDTLQSLHADAIVHVFPNSAIASLAKSAGIGIRIGTTNRVFHWTTVNKLVPLSRKNSRLHEAQLNCKLLEPLGIHINPSLEELASFVGFEKIPVLKPEYEKLIDPSKIKVILHPKSNASAREWSLKRFEELIRLLPANKYQVFISGTKAEKELMADWIKSLPAGVCDITGLFSLEQFIAFISKTDYLVAASTGPLHIAAACGIGAIGIYPPIRPMHPGRWKPLGKKAVALVLGKTCNDCRSNPQSCHCMNDIPAQQVAEEILKQS